MEGNGIGGSTSVFDSQKQYGPVNRRRVALIAREVPCLPGAGCNGSVHYAAGASTPLRSCKVRASLCCEPKQQRSCPGRRRTNKRHALEGLDVHVKFAHLTRLELHAVEDCEKLPCRRIRKS